MKSRRCFNGSVAALVLNCLHASLAIAQVPSDLAAESASTRPGWYLGREIARTMSYHGADWLVRDSREREEQPQMLLDALQLQAGQQVCDFGCGNGYYALRLAALVGPQGKVYAVDIQQEMLELLDSRCQARGISNVEPILATDKDPQLPADELDWVLMVDVYHELSFPSEVLRKIRENLNKEGRLALVEFREEDPSVPIKPLHKMSQVQALKELTANGFKLVGQFDGMPWQHVLFFARDDSQLRSVQLESWTKPNPVASSRQNEAGRSPESVEPADMP
ncbi:MAG: class I SAM-dependent methyltransferase [Planctomycetales bacterium]|nr:class I SAM-dependent methyltransferase [Planctomycetales bacterium]